MNTPPSAQAEAVASTKGIRVTVTDLETGESESVEFDNDYFLVVAGTCYLAASQTYGNGTHQLTIKGRRG